MFSKVNTLCLVLLYFIQYTSSARILILLPAPSLSHHLFYRPIIKELSLRGHSVVSISPDPIHDPSFTNLTEIDVHEEAYGGYNVGKWLEECQKEPESQMAKIRKYTPQFFEFTERILSAPKVKKLLNDPKEHFDLFICELLGSPNFLGFMEHFKCPAIGISSLEVHLAGLDAVGNPADPNYYAGFLMKSGPNLSFWERLNLVWHHIDYRLYYYVEIHKRTSEILEKYFNIKDKTAVELENSIDLVMTNTNPVFHIPKPHVPNYIPIGGLHEPERKALPKDLKTYLDASTNGAIYFSLGSNVKSGNLPENIRRSILKALAQLPYNVIWKWENSNLDDKPKNVLIKKWLPQQDILDHPNMKAFVTQGGLQSIEEAIRSHIPMVGIPFGGDQEFNVDRIVNLGIGRQLNFNDITTELLVEAVSDVAKNQKYKANIIKVERYIWDQPTKPLDRAIWWIEYVLRHKGAKHLRCPAADLPWYKYLLLDIIGFILAIIILLIISGVFCIKIIVKRFLGQSKIKYE